MQAWAPLVGAWTSTGRTVERPGAPPVAIEGTDVYEWLPGRHFLVHTVDVRVGGEQVDVLEVIGEPAAGTYTMRSFDNRGTVSAMSATVDGGVWTFTGDTERARLVIAPDGDSMAATWERRSDGGRWEHWMDMQFRRTGGGGGGS